MYSQILVPTDGSPASDAAIEHAIDLARHYDARLHALYVVDGAAYSTLEAGADIVVEALESEGKEATRRVADAAADAGVDSETTVATGTAYRSIRDYVDENDIDVIVMGTHGPEGARPLPARQRHGAGRPDLRRAGTDGAPTRR